MELQAPEATLVRFGRRVRAKRDSLGLTQEAFAKRCEISVSYASLLERGERSPSYSMLLAVAKALDMGPAELVREPEEQADEADPAHLSLLEFAKRGQLSRAQVQRLIHVGEAMFDVARNTSPAEMCSTPDCERKVLAKGLCALHYHRDRRSRLGAA